MKEKTDIGSKAFSFYGIELRPIGARDLPALRRWRNSDVINQNMLDTSFITPERQIMWYKSILGREDQAHWVVWSQGVRTGYSNIKGKGALHEEQNFEVGGYIGASSIRHVLLGYALILAQWHIGFEELKAETIDILIKGDNQRLIEFNERTGYRRKEETADGMRLSLAREEYPAAQARLLKYFK